MENLLAFFEHAKELFWMVDEQYRLVYGNKAYFTALQQAYGTTLKKGDVVLNLEQTGSDAYNFWKTAYDKALTIGTLNENDQKKCLPNNFPIQFEFKTLNSFIPYICVRETTFSTDATKTNITASEQPHSIESEAELLLIGVNNQGGIATVSEKLVKALGILTNVPDQLTFSSILHPDDVDNAISRFTKHDKVFNHWCRLKMGGNKYVWCNISTTKPDPNNKGFTATLTDIRLQAIPHDNFVPDVNLLEIIAETQQAYITYSNLEKALQPCLSYLYGLGLSHFSFIALLDWKGLQPTLTIPVTYGTLPHFTHHLSNLLQYLSFLCSDAQRDLNNGLTQSINEGFHISFLGEQFMVYNLVHQGKLEGVWVVASSQQKTILAQQNNIIAHLRSVICPLLNSYKATENTTSIIHNLSASKDELLSLVASLDDIVFEVNQSFEFVHIWCNNEAILPKPKDQMLGKSLRQVYSKEFAAPFENAITQVIASGKTENIEFDTVINQQKYWLMARLNYVKLFSGEVRVSMMVRDITDKKLAEVAVAKALAKEKEFNEMKSKMIQSVSHEFRTPLATVVSSTELLEMYIKKNYSIIGERASELFTTIYDEIERLSDMMRNFLVMGRFEENQTPFRPKAVDIHSLIPRIIKTRFHIKYGADKVQFSSENPPQQAEIDEALFWHIVTNIVSNAIKYSPEKEPVFVHLKYLENGYELSIKDQGIGIPEKDLPNIFQSFFRAGNSEDHSGYGLGLSIVERFVKMHQGSISVVSKENMGTTFVLHFKYKII